MKAGIIGLPLCGKTTLFNVLTGRNVETGGYGGGSEPNIGIYIDTVSTIPIVLKSSSTVEIPPIPKLAIRIFKRHNSVFLDLYNSSIKYKKDRYARNTKILNSN